MNILTLHDCEYQKCLLVYLGMLCSKTYCFPHNKHQQFAEALRGSYFENYTGIRSPWDERKSVTTKHQFFSRRSENYRVQAVMIYADARDSSRIIRFRKRQARKNGAKRWRARDLFVRNTFFRATNLSWK